MIRAHALWCYDLTDMITGCDTSHCSQGSEYHIVSATGLPKRRDEDGDLRHSVVRLLPARVIDDRDPRDTHIVQLNVELEGWNEDNWVGLTLNEARELLGQLRDCIRLCNVDRETLLRTDDVLTLVTRLVEQIDDLDDVTRAEIVTVLRSLPASKVTI